MLHSSYARISGCDRDPSPSRVDDRRSYAHESHRVANDVRAHRRLLHRGQQRRFSNALLAMDPTVIPAGRDRLRRGCRQLRVLRVAAATSPGHDAALREAEARLCALPAVVNNWAGRVEQRYSVSSGEGASLAIGISPHLVLRTAFFQDSTGTLIHQGTPLFVQVNELEQGDVVRFSGSFVGHAGVCPDDPPTEENEKLRDPEFIVRFNQVAKATG